MINIKECTPEDLYSDFVKLADEAGFVPSTQLLMYLATESSDGSKGFFVAPASTKYHGNYPGGLYEHSRQVYLRLKELTEKNGLKWKRPESPFIIGMFHDLCKCDQYNKIYDDVTEYVSGRDHMLVPSDKFHYEYNANTLLKGHGAKSVMILSQFINLTEEEMLCIRYHMGPYVQEEQAEFDLSIRKYEGTLWTHLADMLASKADGV